MSQNSKENQIDWEFIQTIDSYQNRKSKLISFSTDRKSLNQGILGNIVKVTLVYEDGTTNDLIVKFQGCTDKTREKLIYELLRECQLSFIPELLYSFDDGTLVMQDLSEYKVRSKRTPCTYQDLEKVLHNMSIIHGHFWNDRRIPREQPHRFAEVIKYNMEQCWDLYFDRYHQLLGTAREDFLWFWENAELVSAVYQPDYGTLVHGDLHQENILDDHYIIDWQLSSFKTPAFDLSFFILQSLDPKERSTGEEGLISSYYDHLPASVKDEYSLKTLKLEYRACVTRSILSSVMMIGPRFSALSDQMEICDLLAERVITAVKELQPIDAINEILGKK